MQVAKLASKGSLQAALEAADAGATCEEVQRRLHTPSKPAAKVGRAPEAVLKSLAVC